MLTSFLVDHGSQNTVAFTSDADNFGKPMKVKTLLKKLSGPLVMIFGCLLPLYPLADLHFDFAYDWKIHLYNIAYYGEYFRQHLSFPSVINTQDLVGWALPLFYGSAFYSFTGLFASFLGAAVAYRLFVVGLFFIQYFLVKKVTELYGGDRFLSHGFALLMTWAIYPLTNIFTRSASTEFAAVATLNCGFFCWILLAGDTDRWKKTILPLAFGFLFAFSAGSHPITALYGGLTFVFFWFFTLLAAKQKKYLLKLSIFSGLAALVVLGPWLYMVAKFQPYLQINGLANKIWFSPQAIDWFWTRVNLFPYDPRPPNDSTPHLDAQMTTPFLLFAFFALSLLFEKRKQTGKKMALPQLTYVAGVLFVIFLVLSNFESLWNHIPVRYHVIQMAYRLVSYLNLTIFFVAVSLLKVLASLGDASAIKKVKFLVGILLVVAFVAVLIKNGRDEDTQNWGRIAGIVERSPLELLPAIPYRFQNMARNNYVTDSLFIQEAHPNTTIPPITIPMLTTPHDFGKTGEFQFKTDQDSIIPTNVQAFPWNRILIDGNLVMYGNTMEYANNLAVKVKAGVHKASYLFVPDSAWTLLQTVSFYFFMGWILLLAVAGIWQTLKA